jgi:hypothetical protein
MNFDNKIPFQQAIDLGKKVASGDLSLQVVKEACWVLGCTIEALDGVTPEPPRIATMPGNELAELQLQAEEISEMQSGFGNAAEITPAQIAMIIQFALTIIKLFRK